MANILNPDFRDFLAAFNEQQVKYMLVGGFSVILRGYSRTTGHMDIWVEQTADNYQKIKPAFHQFGMPVLDMTEKNFLFHPAWDVFTFGVPPVAIDIITKIEHLDFETCYKRSVLFEEDGLAIRTIHRNNLTEAKKMRDNIKILTICKTPVLYNNH
ncbi:hypothetical protein [Niabella aquatica]